MITYDNTTKIFTIHTDNSTYQMQADGFGCLLHLYYGRRTQGAMSWGLKFMDRGFSGNPTPDRTYSLDVLPQEFPTQGTGDYRTPALVVRDSEGTYGAVLHYAGHEIINGKYGLAGLPAVHAEDAQTLIITLKDERLNLTVKLLYGVLPAKDIITRSVIVRNDGQAPVTVMKLASANLDFTHGRFDLITFYGRHEMERQFQRQRLLHGTFSAGSRRGMSSHQYNPFVILADHDATETAGRCWGMRYVYSGGFLAEAEHDQYSQTRLMMGLAQEKFAYELCAGEELIGPEVIMTFSSEGLGRLSRNYHDCIRENICRDRRPSPIVLNTWEALYFNFDGRKILDVARSAKGLGVDMLVLDDGWFMNRNDDNRALGDWTADTKKLGCTLGDLVKEVNALGLRFGLWVEPEMVSEDSSLYRSHPDWAMAVPHENPILGRNQLVLDMSRREVREYVYSSIAAILAEGNIEYLKWDYNRSIAAVYSYTSDNQGKVMYDYMLGLYEVLERLHTEYPDVLIEGCAGGGGRFDAGMLYYTPQIWCSDNTDALDRMSIHYGTSFGYPMRAVAAHVSTCPNHQTGRTIPLRTRFTVSMAGGFGYELNPLTLTDEERSEIAEQVRQYRLDRELIVDGEYYRLSSPLEDDYIAWEYVSRDGRKVLMNAVIPYNHGNMELVYVVLRGLTHDAFYRDMESGKVYPSDALMDAGIPLEMPKGDCEAFTFRLERV